MNSFTDDEILLSRSFSILSLLLAPVRAGKKVEQGLKVGEVDECENPFFFFFTSPDSRVLIR